MGGYVINGPTSYWPTNNIETFSLKLEYVSQTYLSWNTIYHMTLLRIPMKIIVNLLEETACVMEMTSL